MDDDNTRPLTLPVGVVGDPGRGELFDKLAQDFGAAGDHDVLGTVVNSNRNILFMGTNEVGNPAPVGHHRGHHSLARKRLHEPRTMRDQR